jgi:hypothetical protein
MTQQQQRVILVADIKKPGGGKMNRCAKIGVSIIVGSLVIFFLIGYVLCQVL